MCLLFVACSYGDDIPGVNYRQFEQSQTSDQCIRSKEDAIEIAQNALILLYDAPRSRNQDFRKIDYLSPIHVLTASSDGSIVSRNMTCDAAHNDTLMYVVNYADSMGFAIVSAIPYGPDLIAVTASGSYNPDEPIENPGFNFFMEAATDYLQVQSTSLITPPPFQRVPEYKEVKDTTWFANIDNRVRVYWGQTAPEGTWCDNGYAGCANTAAAILMSHFAFPKRLKLTFLENDLTIDLDWEKLRKHHEMQSGATKYSEKCEPSTHTMLAYLCRELGHRSHSDYQKWPKRQTPTPWNNTINALRKLGYHVEDKQYCEGAFREELKSCDCVLLVSGTDTASKDENAHMWVCDAVKSFHVHTKVYERPGGLYFSDTGWTYVMSYDEYSTFNFFNWGWGTGDSNYELCGYFLDEVFSVHLNGALINNFNKDVRYLKITL